MSGYSPLREDLVLTRDADYVHRFAKESSDPAFPASTTAEIVITASDRIDAPIIASWPADSVTASEITFWVQQSVTNLIPARYRYRLMVHYPPAAPGFAAQDFCWYRGAVKREQ